MCAIVTLSLKATYLLISYKISRDCWNG